jgi:two-component sensor histidine kinase
MRFGKRRSRSIPRCPEADLIQEAGSHFCDCGPATNRHDQALVAIKACIFEGVNTKPGLISALARCGFKRGHIASVLEELQHRVKNHISLIMSVVRIRSRRAKSEEAREALDAVGERIETLRLLHEQLYVGGTVPSAAIASGCA